MMMDLEVSEQIRAGKYEHNPQRRTQRNGYRELLWETRVGEIHLRIPKLRSGSYFPSLLEPRRRSEKALLAVVQQAYIKGVSTRKVDDLLQAMGLTGIFPDRDAVIRLVGSLLMEINDEWQIGRRYFSLASMKELLEPDDENKIAALSIPLARVH